MGTFSVDIRVASMGCQVSENLPALVDTGAVFTVVPASTLSRLGVVPTTSRTFEYANGEQAELGIAEARVTADGHETMTWVMFGEDESGEALLGSYTLQGLFLGADTRNERLVPAVPRLCRHYISSTTRSS